MPWRRGPERDCAMYISVLRRGLLSRGAVGNILQKHFFTFEKYLDEIK